MTKKMTNNPHCSISGSNNSDDLKKTIAHHVLSFQGRDPKRANNSDIYKAAAYTLRDTLVERWIETQQGYYDKSKKRVYYLSLEFLVGRSLGNSAINLGLIDQFETALVEMGYDLEEVRDSEEDAALGNGGLGRLAACFLDSMATLGIPAYGYGIRYEYGLFFQHLINGYQVESPDNWLRYGTPWEFERPQQLHPVKFYGRVNTYTDKDGKLHKEWVDAEEVMAMACDMLVPGYRNDNVINMRLWTARASRELDLSFFSKGDYITAVKNKVKSETISKVLYPSDQLREGQELRLRQQYFFVAATFQDIFRRYRKKKYPLHEFTNRNAVQLNDTHPSIAIPELMRILIDIEKIDWDEAWDICVNTFAYTNHTLMPEALEKWSVDMLGRVLPRHLEIIYEINWRFMDEVERRYPGDGEKKIRLSIIEEGPVKKVRMAHLAFVGSHSVNGVAELHTHLLKTVIFKDFHEFFPDRLNNKTNGITQRRWLLKCNSGLAALIIGKIGDGWITDLDQLRKLEKWAENKTFQKKWRQVKRDNKVKLTDFIRSSCNIEVSADSMFDVQVKRIHEYKRQLLNVLHVIVLYNRIINDPDCDMTSRTVIFAGKAAPSYERAKLIIKLITSVAVAVNSDPRCANKLKVAFIPNYGVSLAEKIFPASDLSEQISTAGTEASGTGNMKFALNGALTIGTLDGANIEIREEVGAENIFIFGMTAEDAEEERANPGRSPHEIYCANPEVRQAIDSIINGRFSNGDGGLFRPIVDSLFDANDRYLLIKDLEDYIRCQNEVCAEYKDQFHWTRKSILNVARMGKFSSDRTIREYARDIWGIDV